MDAKLQALRQQKAERDMLVEQLAHANQLVVLKNMKMAAMRAEALYEINMDLYLTEDGK